ncbi:MAG TPA: GEVED domain-containing protein [Bacteroidia bacterium]|jgi:hypothetical protein|nr:GEVED domain-containing protein [Bacteroidia bacterium]
MIQKKHRYTLAFALLLFIQIFKAQVTITIPSGTVHTTGLLNSEWRKPFGTYFGYERSAMIYSHAEIGQFGNINSVSFYCDTINTPGNTPVTIYMKEVPSYTFTGGGTTVANEESGAQLVYTGTLTSAAFVKNNWTTITFTSPFLHATSNAVEIIIETNATGTGNELSLGKGFYHYSTSIYAFQYWSSDNIPPTNAGTFSYHRPNVQFNLTPVSGCSGTPNPGTTVSSVDTTCSGVSLWLTGNTSATGLTYQWQDSLSGGAWISIGNTTSSTLVTGISANTWFRCKVSCSNSSSYSAVKQVIMRNYLQCYCNMNLGGNCATSAVDSVAITTTTLANGLTGCSPNYYIQYPAIGNTCGQLASGQSYNLHTKFKGNVIASVWLDYNQNGMFDSLEWKQICLTSVTDSDYVSVLAVPANAKTGLILMRVRSRAAGNLNGYNDACVNFGSGETEDYFIGINYDVRTAEIGNPVSEILIYPNPATESILITGGFMPGENVDVKIYSIEGSLQSETNVIYSGKPLKTDVSTLISGAYFVKISSAGFSIVKKMLINR